MSDQTVKLKKKPTKLEDMSKEEIRQAILKKRECNVKAIKIVESLLEKNITEEYFIHSLSDINQSHFEDIIEERSIIKLCGYPLCSNTISDKDIPKQQYRISMKTNKVYDISTRKSFCSNSCYKSAIFVKKQMLTSPLWFREYENIPKFHLLPLDCPGSMGQEIDLALVEKLNIKDEKPTFKSVNDFAQDTIKTISNKENISEIAENQKYLESKPSQAAQEQNRSISGTETSENPTCSSNLSSSPKNNKKHITNPLNIVGDIIEKPEKKIDPILIEKPSSSNRKTKDEPYIEKEAKLAKKKTKKQHAMSVITIEVEKHLAEWFTLDTLIFLLGEEKVREMVADKGESIKKYLNDYSKSIYYTSNTYDQYQSLCRKLNMLELEDRKNNSQVQRETKPLPDYSILHEESKKIQIKVKAFLAGKAETEETVDPTVDIATKNMDDKNLTQIPLVDKNAQNAIRRKIVCQQLNKVLPDLLRSLGLLTLSISSDVKLLVNTFKLKADNIMFRPIQWTLLAIIFIKLLSIRDKHLEYLLKQNTTYQHMQLLLLSYQQREGYLDRLINWLMDVDRLLCVNDMQREVY